MQEQSVDQSKPRQGALTRVKEIHQNRGQRARELKQQGKTVIGYLCSFPPVEILTAADTIPCRIIGNRQEPVSAAEAYLEPHMCSSVRSCLDEVRAWFATTAKIESA